MNSTELSFRPIEKKDFSALEDIIRKTWNYDRFCSPKIAKAMSRLYLSSCLTNQTFTCVAIANNKPVGIIMAKTLYKHKASLCHQLKCIKDALSIAISAEGRKISRMYRGIDTLDQELLTSTNQSFDGELAFFAIDSQQRGKGVGKMLFQRFYHYARSEGWRNFYLFTDCTCNFGFYEHQGLCRLGERNFTLRPYVDADMDFFIYVGTVQ